MDKDRIEGSEKGIIGKIKEAQGALKLILEPIFEAEVRRSTRARHDARHTPRRLRIRRKSNPRAGSFFSLACFAFISADDMRLPTIAPAGVQCSQ
jgi:hypothetical protein